MSLKPISRKQGRSAVAANAYRRGEKLYDERTGKTHDYTRKRDIIHKEILLPDDAPPEFLNSQTLWNAVERVETRQDSRVAKEFVLALPRELKFETHLALIREFASKCITPHGLCADVAIHEGHSKGMQSIEDDHDEIQPHNPHCHILITDRPLDREGFSPKKNPGLNKMEFLKKCRKEWADIQNRMFVRKGLKVRASHESYKARGVDCEPTLHLGPVFSEMERRGIETIFGNENRARARRNEERALRDEQGRKRSHGRSR